MPNPTKPYDAVILNIPCLRTKDEFSVASPTDIWSEICSVNVKILQMEFIIILQIELVYKALYVIYSY